MASQQQNNVEVLREGYEAFNDQNMEAVTENFDEDVEFVEPEGSRYGGTYHGPETVVEDLFGRIVSDIEDLHLDTDRFIDGGDTVVVTGSIQGTASETGETLDIPFAHVVDMEDGRITRLQDNVDTARLQEALEA